MGAIPKVYCEHGALSPQLKALQKNGRIELVHFPADITRSGSLKPSAVPSQVQWRDMGLSWEDCSFAWEDAKGSEKYEDILRLVGHQNRRDALHVDSAFKTRCMCLVTEDSDILSVRDSLLTLLGLRIFSPKEDSLYAFLPK
jgi:hypothetical protein